MTWPPSSPASLFVSLALHPNSFPFGVQWSFPERGCTLPFPSALPVPPLLPCSSFLPLSLCFPGLFYPCSTLPPLWPLSGAPMAPRLSLSCSAGGDSSALSSSLVSTPPLGPCPRLERSMDLKGGCGHMVATSEPSRGTCLLPEHQQSLWFQKAVVGEALFGPDLLCWAFSMLSLFTAPTHPRPQVESCRPSVFPHTVHAGLWLPNPAGAAGVPGVGWAAG